MAVMRVKLARTAPARWLEHREFVQIVRDAVLRAGLPVAGGRGAPPAPCITPGPPLRAGYLSRGEYVDFELTEPTTAREFGRRLAAELPPGLEVVWQRRLPARAKHLRAAVTGFTYTVSARLDPARARAFAEATTWPHVRVRPARVQEFDLKRSVSRLDVRPEQARIDIEVRPDGTPKLEEVLESIFGIPPEESATIPTERAAVKLEQPYPLNHRIMEQL
ncbi:MAG: DUF2344 domain-containing protein [Candidatus Hydrogenedentes bacterium]|nr:DUF2344 domain-containing protein [Candidatus Hydrogenedentota bacterium]